MAVEDAHKTLAKEATEKLLKLVERLKTKQPKDLFWSSLCSHLQTLNLWFQEQTGGIDRETITRILELMDSLCKGTTKRTQLGNADVSLQEPFPGLSGLLRNSLSTERSLRSLSVTISTPPAEVQTRKKKRRIITTKLEKLTGDINNIAVSKPQLAKHDNDDFSPHVGTLYSVLSHYCFCQKIAPQYRINPKIRLNGIRKHTESGTWFDLLFRDHPHQGHATCNGSWHWQEVTVHVSPAVSWEDKPSELASSAPMIAEEFCTNITRRQPAPLYLTLSRKEMTLREIEYLEEQTASKSLDYTAQAMSLRKILLSHQLLPAVDWKMKHALVYFLARGIWQFHDSDLMRRVWTKDSVEFVVEHREQNGKWNMGIYLNEPLVSISFDEPLPSDEVAYKPHKFPKIQELGIMLVEIVLWREIDSYREQYPQWLTNGQPNKYTDYRIAKHLYEKEIKNHLSIIEPLKDLVGNCFSDQYFSPRGKDHDAKAYLRGAIYERLVRPLESWISVSYGGCHDVYPLPSLETTSALSIAPVSYGKHQNEPTPRQTSEADVKGSVMVTRLAQLSADHWFDKLGDVNDLLRAKRGERASYRPVRIAVLDTGILPDDPYVQDMGDDMYKDFIEKTNTQKRDSAGHGTDTVNLVFKVFEEADIYVARVFEEDVQSLDTPNLVAEAIDWAREKAVDIIVMAFGFTEAHPGIVSAIERATAEHILMFAAAANWSNLERIAFPASMADHVMCVFSTNAGLKSSESFNPGARKWAINLAILGEDVTMTPGRTVSGTSISTAIAAGVAGRLLDFSRQTACQGLISDSALKRKAGMTAMFQDLAKDHAGYHCIAPWRILQRIHVAADAARLAKRVGIGKWMASVLDNQE